MINPHRFVYHHFDEDPVRSCPGPHNTINLRSDDEDYVPDVEICPHENDNINNDEPQYTMRMADINLGWSSNGDPYEISYNSPDEYESEEDEEEDDDESRARLAPTADSLDIKRSKYDDEK
ncbi:hypothetical protein GEMRC1_001253 [Eukaryota sp. GEM-RC1]